MLGRLFRTRRHDEMAHSLYLALVEQARLPVFYDRFEVPDSLDGRFDMVALHAFLVMKRLKSAAEQTDAPMVDGKKGRPAAPDTVSGVSQALFDVMFADMDSSLRELGVGDLSVGKKVRKMAEGFLGRVAAYDEGLAAENPEILQAALQRNLYGTAAPSAAGVAAMAAYVRQQEAVLAGQGVEALMAGKVAFQTPEIIPSGEGA